MQNNKKNINFNIVNETYNIPVKFAINDENLIVHPYFQRNYVWDDKKASALIESILLTYPIPSIYIYDDIDTKKQIVIDGQQRLTSLKRFVQGSFALKELSYFEELNGLHFDELYDEYKDSIKNYKLSMMCLKNIHDKEVIFDVFRRYNTGGVHLNQQEIRNCIYSGPFNNLINELASNKDFVTLFDNTKIDRMEKEEYVLRFLAMYDSFDDYNGNLNKFLDDYLSSKINIDESNSNKKIEYLKNKFLHSLSACKYVFGDDVFKNCLDFQTGKGKKTIMYKLISKPVFDLQMLGFADFDSLLIKKYAKELKAKYEEVLRIDENIRPYYKKMSRKAVSYRINQWKLHIKSIIE